MAASERAPAACTHLQECVDRHPVCPGGQPVAASASHLRSVCTAAATTAPTATTAATSRCADIAALSSTRGGGSVTRCRPDGILPVRAGFCGVNGHAHAWTDPASRRRRARVGSSHRRLWHASIVVVDTQAGKEGREGRERGQGRWHGRRRKCGAPRLTVISSTKLRSLASWATNHTCLWS